MRYLSEESEEVKSDSEKVALKVENAVLKKTIKDLNNKLNS